MIDEPILTPEQRAQRIRALCAAAGPGVTPAHVQHYLDGDMKITEIMRELTEFLAHRDNVEIDTSPRRRD